MTKQKVYIMMILTTMFWSGAFITGKLALQEFPPFTLTFFRFFLALPFIFGILIWRQPAEWIPTRNQWGPLILVGITGIFLYHTLFFYSLKYTSAINSSLIGASNPMITAFLAMVFLSSKVRPLQGLGMLCSISGVVMVVTNGDLGVLGNLAFNIGDVLMFLGVIAWAGYSVISSKIMEKYAISPLMLTAYAFLVCTLVSIPGVIWDGSIKLLPNITLGGWMSVLYMAVFSSVLGYLFQTIAIQQIGAYRASVFNNLVPVFTIAQSVIILGEEFSIFKLVCTGLIIFGVYLTVRPQGPQKPQELQEPLTSYRNASHSQV